MNKIICALLLATTSATLLVGCKHATVHEHAQQYTCPHHPGVVQATPGDCPKCGMKLEAKE